MSAVAPAAAPDPAGPGPRYAAFISYSHAADGKLAPALQRGLHRFARPWYRLRAIRVFRDDTNLAVSPGLWTSITQALEVSRYFVLLASPQAAASRWVEKELDFWLGHQPADTVLIVLTEGEVVWDPAAGDFDWTRTTAVPARLARVFREEPLFLDLRWARSAVDLSLDNPAFRDRVADLSAALRGVSKDEIVGEDVQQHRRTTLVVRATIAALSVLTLAAVTFAAVAVWERNEAVRQRNQALARQLAAQADLARQQRDDPERSALLATEAVRVLWATKARVAEVDLALRRSLGALAASTSRFEEHGSAQLSLSRDGRYVTAQLLSGAYQGLWDASTDPAVRRAALPGKSAATIGPRYAMPCASTPDGGVVVAQTIDGGPTVLEVRETHPVSRLASVDLPGAHHDCAFSPDGALLAVTSGDSDSAKTTRIWTVRPFETVFVRERSRFVGFGPGGMFATTTALWRRSPDGRGSTQIHSWAAEPFRVVFSRNGRYLATQFDYEGAIEILDLERGVAPAKAKAAPGELMAISDDGEEIALSAPGLTFWDVRKGRVRAQSPIEPVDAAFDASGDVVILTSQPTSLGAQVVRVSKLHRAGVSTALWKMKAGERVHWIGPGPGTAVFALVTGGTSIRVEAWRWAEGTTATVVELPGAISSSWTVDDAGDHYAVASAGKVVVGRIDGSGARSEIPQPEPPAQLVLSAGGEYLVAADPGRLEVWEVSRPRRIATYRFEGTPGAVRISRDGAVASALVLGGQASRAGHLYTVMRWRTAEPSAPLVLPVGRHLRFTACELEGAARAAYFAGVGPDAARPWWAFGWLARWTARAPAAAPAERSCEGGATAGVPLEHLGYESLGLLTTTRDGRYLAAVEDDEYLRVWPVAPAELIAQACSRLTRRLTAKEWRAVFATPSTVDSCGRPLEPGEQ